MRKQRGPREKGRSGAISGHRFLHPAGYYAGRAPNFTRIRSAPHTRQIAPSNGASVFIDLETAPG